MKKFNTWYFQSFGCELRVHMCFNKRIGDSSIGTTTIHFYSLNQERIVSGSGNPVILRPFNSPGTIPIGGCLSGGGNAPRSVLFSNSNYIFWIGYESEKKWVAFVDQSPIFFVFFCSVEILHGIKNLTVLLKSYTE